MGYTHLDIYERERIMQLHYIGLSYREISRMLDRSVSTISREIRRNTRKGTYSPHQAQHLYLWRRHKRRGTRLLRHAARLEYVMHGLCENWSPEQIAQRMKLDHPDNPTMRISHATIYRWIWRDKRRDGKLCHHLRQRGRPWKRPGQKTSWGRLTNYRDIDERPEVVDKRERYGDWELDTLWGSRGKPVLVTCVERKSLYTLAVKIPDRQVTSCNQGIIKALDSLEPELIKTMTVDHGKEFNGVRDLESILKAEIYHAKPYHPWQRGRNENTNGLLRQYFPKTKTFNAVSQAEVNWAVARLNNRPRKTLGFKTPNEILTELPCCTSLDNPQ